MTMITMQESQLREAISKNLPNILFTGLKGIYPLNFRCETFAAKDFRLETPIASSQLAYTENWQILSFILIDPAQMLKLGVRAFPKLSRSDAPKMVVSANGEVLNSASSKLGFILGKMDSARKVSLTPPAAMNFSGENALDIACSDSVFLKLVCEEIDILFISSIQKI
jgi:hypothetical protein